MRIIRRPCRSAFVVPFTARQSHIFKDLKIFAALKVWRNDFMTSPSRDDDEKLMALKEKGKIEFLALCRRTRVKNVCHELTFILLHFPAFFLSLARFSFR